jgi:hypothetical protein
MVMSTPKRSSRLHRWMQVLILTAVMVYFAVQVHAQEVSATAKVDSNHILIGQWLRLSLEIRHPSAVPVTLAPLPDSLDRFTIIRRDTPVVQASGSQALTSINFVVTAFDSGMQIIPPVTVYYRSEGDTVAKTLRTNPVTVNVGGVAVDTSKDIRDIKPPLSVPITFADVLPYLIGCAVAGALFWLVRYIVRKRRRGESLIPEAPPRPAHEVALEKLTALDSEKLWQRGKIKEFHSQVTDIVRTYIEGRYRVMAMEMVSDEILSSPQIRALSPELQASVRVLLTRADLVKFAKYQPTGSENENCIPAAMGFVHATRQDHSVTESEPAAPVTGGQQA